MSLTLATPLLSSHPVVPSQAVAAILSAANRTRYTDVDVRHLVTRFFHWCRLFGFNPLLVLSQVVHETDYLRFTGDVKFGQHNFAGLGATGGVPGHSFPLPNGLIQGGGIDAGVIAVVAHHAAYRWGRRENWPAHLQQYAGEHVDPRYDEVLASGNAGKMITLNDYRGTWAVPGTHYPEGLIRAANHILSFPVEQEPPMPIDRDTMRRLLNDRYPLAIRIDHIPAGNSNRPATPAITEGRRWLTIHETGNLNVEANAEMHRRFSHGSGGYGGGGYAPTASDPQGYEGVSFTWTVDDREAIQLLPRAEKSWQASDGAGGTGNSSESTETCVNADGDWGKTKENLARLQARLIVEDPENSPDRIAQHNQWARDGKNCPQRLRANGGREWDAVVVRIRAILTDVGYFGAVVVPPANYRFFTETGHGIGGGFKEYWLHNGGLYIFGYPLSEELDEPGADGVVRTTQYFERCVMEYHPTNPPPFDVLLRRLGAEALERREAA